MGKQEQLGKFFDKHGTVIAFGLAVPSLIGMIGGLAVASILENDYYNEHHKAANPTSTTESEDISSFENSFNSPWQLTPIPQQNPQE